MLSNVASRLAVMHEAGYVHRDLKPANVMWLPRENRWTVIDFGCVAGIGQVAPLSFTLAYSSPEVVRAHEAGAACLEVTAALDSWSLGVMAFELLTGAPAFKFLTEGRAKVRTRAMPEPHLAISPGLHEIHILHRLVTDPHLTLSAALVMRFPSYNTLRCMLRLFTSVQAHLVELGQAVCMVMVAYRSVPEMGVYHPENVPIS